MLISNLSPSSVLILTLRVYSGLVVPSLLRLQMKTGVRIGCSVHLEKRAEKLFALLNSFAGSLN
jgi:hypothetical protein